MQAGSTGTVLKFVHAAGSQAQSSPTPTLSDISLSGRHPDPDRLRVAIGGAAPTWTFSSTATTTQLLTGVAPIPPSSSIFTYYRSSNGAVSATPQSTPLASTASAADDPGPASPSVPARGRRRSPTPAPPPSIRDSATLRLTPPSFNESAPSLPCQ